MYCGNLSVGHCHGLGPVESACDMEAGVKLHLGSDGLPSRTIGLVGCRRQYGYDPDPQEVAPDYLSWVHFAVKRPAGAASAVGDGVAACGICTSLKLVATKSRPEISSLRKASI